MKYLKTIVSSFLIVATINGINAQNPNGDEKHFDISSIEYIEEEDFDLGFNTSEYLPEDFDPYQYYFDLNSISMWRMFMSILILKKIYQDILMCLQTRRIFEM